MTPSSDMQSIYISVLKHGQSIKAALNWDGIYRVVTYEPKLDRYIKARDGEGITVSDALYINEYQPLYNIYDLPQ